MQSTSVETMIQIVGNFGFPLVLASYLLLRFEKKIENLTEVIRELEETIQDHK